MEEGAGSPGPLPGEALAHYTEHIAEAQRLLRGGGLVERARTQELILRYLPPPPGMILDVGGGAGVYACWLATLGYAVTLLDAVPLHVEQALAASAAQPDHPLAGVAVGDARHLDRPDAGVDAVLLLGPLYHLTERADRLQALAEARRVVRPGGWVFAAAVSRFASLFDGLFRGLLDDPVFAGIVAQDLTDGQHRNPTHHPAYFTTTFFHHADELRAELEEAGLADVTIFGVEGPGWLLPDLGARWADPPRQAQLLALLRRIEQEPTLLGLSAHLLAVGRRTMDE